MHMRVRRGTKTCLAAKSLQTFRVVLVVVVVAVVCARCSLLSLSLFRNGFLVCSSYS